ncbi:hypothetical protein Pcinc_040339 [Petrolisthes cinctipes]|uniref:Uncharacterized protein n=1 Tax=Petrolisthes cinctipes TaxID=88211 RepID=A0AAE1BPT2_PETCI|nr:hypothetical protein Pcinc_040339 [Petrolisthes cinctipes]
MTLDKSMTEAETRTQTPLLSSQSSTRGPATGQVSVPSHTPLPAATLNLWLRYWLLRTLGTPYSDIGSRTHFSSNFFASFGDRGDGRLSCLIGNWIHNLLSVALAPSGTVAR